VPAVIRIINGFAYTGGSTIAAARVAAEGLGVQVKKKKKNVKNIYIKKKYKRPMHVRRHSNACQEGSYAHISYACKEVHTFFFFS
jgi:hypothetical protein